MTDKEIKEVFDFYKKAGQKSLIYESISDQLMHVDSNEFSKIAFIDNWAKENDTQVQKFTKNIEDKFVEEYKKRLDELVNYVKENELFLKPVEYCCDTGYQHIGISICNVCGLPFDLLNNAP